MERIAYNRLYEKAERLNASGARWHFHMLSPECVYNVHKGRFALVLENEMTGESWYTLFDDRPLPESKRLAVLSYGEGFLDEKPAEGPSNPDFKPILDRARLCAEKGIEWHNHHLYPGCMYNPSKGKHCIVFEDNETPEPLVAVYDEKPMKDLAAIERLLYGEEEN